MKLHRTDGAWVDGLTLPMPHVPGPYDAEGYRRRARGEEPLVQRQYVPASRIRTITLSAGPLTGSVAEHFGGIIFISAGVLRIATSDTEVALQPGDVVMAEPAAVGGYRISADRQTRLVQFDLTGPVERHGPWVTPESGAGPSADRTPNVKQMRKTPDDTSLFHGFDDFFPGETDRWSAARPVVGLMFGEYPDGAFIDWHPEVLNQLVLILTGCLELEVEDRHIERFAAGDVVLAADRTGRGHIDRFHGRTAVALAVIEDDALWPAPA
ncbi:hypothetical protein [Mycobacterium sp. C31M]